MNLRTRLCFALSRRLMGTPSPHTADRTAYAAWRHAELAEGWADFADEHIAGKDVLDFGCGDGELTLLLAARKKPRRIVGVDIDAAAVHRAKAAAARLGRGPAVDFLTGTPDHIPAADRSFDTLLAFECLEHVMAPAAALSEWHRVLRPGGRCLIRWFPWHGPWGPHMDALIPIPWAHVLFGQRALFRTAAMVYDLPEYTPRHWDLDDEGRKKPNKWRAWTTFEEQGYVNRLSVAAFRTLARAAGFHIARDETRSFQGTRLRKILGRMLMSTPLLGRYFVSHVILELQRNPTSELEDR